MCQKSIQLPENFKHLGLYAYRADESQRGLSKFEHLFCDECGDALTVFRCGKCAGTEWYSDGECWQRCNCVGKYTSMPWSFCLSCSDPDEIHGACEEQERDMSDEDGFNTCLTKLSGKFYLSNESADYCTRGHQTIQGAESEIRRYFGELYRVDRWEHVCLRETF